MNSAGRVITICTIVSPVFGKVADIADSADDIAMADICIIEIRKIVIAIFLFCFILPFRFIPISGAAECLAPSGKEFIAV